MKNSEDNIVLSCASITSGYSDAMVVHDISFQVELGSIYTILGKNGMGKTTLLKTVMGFLKPVSGNLHLLGEDSTGMEPQWLVQRGVAYVPQEAAIFQDLSVEDNLRLGVSRDRYLKRGIEKIASYFPVIPQRLKQKAGTLSGGEQKMLLMSRALMSEPKLLLIDEISEGLQPSMVTRIVEVLKRLASEENTSILMAEQNIGLVSRVSDLVALINIGRIVEERVLADSRRSEDELLSLMKI